jgi:hypothetical protein
MKAELLALMYPSSCDLESIGSKNHNAVTSDDINIKLAYSKINDMELNLLLAKFLDDDRCRSELFWKLYDSSKEIVGDKYAKKYLEIAIMERIMTTCPFCNGTGVMIFKNKIETCSHCKEGNFIYSDDVVANLIGIKPQKFKKKAYNKIINKLMDIEDSALSKIGDT